VLPEAGQAYAQLSITALSLPLALRDALSISIRVTFKIRDAYYREVTVALEQAYG
jgi:hypothetical protein